MPYTCEFADGHRAPILVRGRTPNYLIGVAKDHRGYARTMFFTEDAVCQPDPWIAAVHVDKLAIHPGHKLERVS